MGKVRSPRRGHTIGQLRKLREDNWHNPDTGTEISEEEGADYLKGLEQNAADRAIEKHLKVMNAHGAKLRSRKRAMIPKDEVIFRRIGGRNVPFRRGSQVGL